MFDLVWTMELIVLFRKIKAEEREFGERHDVRETIVLFGKREFGEKKTRR